MAKEALLRSLEILSVATTQPNCCDSRLQSKATLAKIPQNCFDSAQSFPNCFDSQFPPKPCQIELIQFHIGHFFASLFFASRPSL